MYIYIFTYKNPWYSLKHFSYILLVELFYFKKAAINNFMKKSNIANNDINKDIQVLKQFFGPNR